MRPQLRESLAVASVHLAYAERAVHRPLAHVDVALQAGRWRSIGPEQPFDFAGPVHRANAREKRIGDAFVLCPLFEILPGHSSLALFATPTGRAGREAFEHSV